MRARHPDLRPEPVDLPPSDMPHESSPVEEDPLLQATLASEFEDFKVLGDLHTINCKELFDEQFIDFIRWFKKDIFSRYTKADFRRIERKNFLHLVFGYLAVLVTYILCHIFIPAHLVVWGVPLFIASVWV